MNSEPFVKQTENRLGQYFVLLMIFSAGFFGYVMHSIDWFRAIPGDLVDARFNSIVLEHVLKWLQGKVPDLWSPTFFYPFENVLAFSDNHFGTFWSYAIARIAGLQREHAFLVWFIVGNVLNFWVSFYVFRKLGFSILAAAAGAFVFAFALPALPKEGHAQLIYRFASPLSFLAFFDFIQNKRLSSLARTLFWLAVQFFCSIYIGIFLVYLLLAVLIAFALIKPRLLLVNWQRGWLSQEYAMRLWSVALFFLSVLAILWLLHHYHAASVEYGIKRTATEILSMIPRPSSYLIADRSLLTGWLGQFVPQQLMRHELQMFFGLGVCVLAGVGIWQIWTTRSDNKIGLVAMISLFILIVMTLSVFGASFYRWMLYLPGVSSIRAVSRVVLIMLLPLGLLVAVCFDAALHKIRSTGVKWTVVAAITALLVVETIFYQPYNTPLGAWIQRQHALKNLLPLVVSDDAILYVTSTLANRGNDITEVDGVILAQDLGKPTLNGYSGNVPPGYFRPDPCLDFKDRLRSYFEFAPKAAFNEDALFKRVLVISPEACPNLPAVQTNKLIDSAFARQIHLSISGEIAQRTLLAKVTIKNASDQALSSLSKRGPIRLSWRIVTLDDSGQIKNQPDLSPRKDLFFTLEPGMEQVESLLVEAPAQPGKYILQVSLVQEGVTWLHELGMQMAEWPFLVK